MSGCLYVGHYSPWTNSVRPTELVNMFSSVFQSPLNFFLLINALSGNVQKRDNKIHPTPGSVLKLNAFFFSPFHILLCFMKTQSQVG